MRAAEIAPPFVDEQFVNVNPERVASEEMEVNSNTPPFPDSRLIDVNGFVPFIFRLSIETSIKGASIVVYVDVAVMVINLRVTFDVVTPMRKHPSFISL